MALDTTVPSRTLRRLTRVGVSSAIVGLLGSLGGGDLALAQQRVDTGDVLAQLRKAVEVVELAGDVLEPEVEQLGLGLGQAGLQLVVLQVAELLHASGHQTSTPSC